MAASFEDISGWFDNAKKKGATHMIVVCDTYDHDDYPALVLPTDDFWERYDHFNGRNMQTIMEVYDLSLDKKTQMNERRAMHCPPRK